MNEYTIVEALLEEAEGAARAHGATGVRRLSMWIGELSGVEPRALTAAYETCRDSTLCEHASLAVQMIPARWICPSCGSPVRRGDVLNCQRCEIPARLLEGDEVQLDRIDLEVP